AEKKAAQLVEAAILTHSNKGVQKAMRNPAKASGWYFSTPKLAEYRARIERERRKGEKGIIAAQKVLDAAIAKRNAYIEKKDNATESVKAELLSIYQKEQASKDKLKGNSNNVLLLLDLSTGALMTLLSLIIALMIKNNPGVKVPEAGSITEMIFKVIMSGKKLVIIGLELLTRSDLDGDGFIGVKKTEFIMAEPTLIKTGAPDIETERKFQSLAAKIEALELEKELAKKLKFSQTEKQNLAKTENAKKSKPKTKNPFSPNVLGGKLAKVSDQKGFEKLAKKSQESLLSSEKIILKLAKVSVAKKHYDNAILAIKNSKKEETEKRAKVKALWLAKILGIKDNLI
ncbi:MAG TPA: hypothetical protein VMW66_02115, partial [Elusimicrobiales bacterium]|nr:hypothetical protein [Elusimicrobiales bacterium]